MNKSNDIARVKLQFSYDLGLTYEDYCKEKEANPRFTKWAGKKVVAIPACLVVGMVLTIVHLCIIIFRGIPATLALKPRYIIEDTFRFARDFQESLGWFVTLFHYQKGQYIVTVAREHKRLYGLYDPQLVKNEAVGVPKVSPQSVETLKEQKQTEFPKTHSEASTEPPVVPKVEEVAPLSDEQIELTADEVYLTCQWIFIENRYDKMKACSENQQNTYQMGKASNPYDYILDAENLSNDLSRIIENLKMKDKQSFYYFISERLSKFDISKLKKTDLWNIFENMSAATIKNVLAETHNVNIENHQVVKAWEEGKLPQKVLKVIKEEHDKMVNFLRTNKE